MAKITYEFNIDENKEDIFNLELLKNAPNLAKALNEIHNELVIYYNYPDNVSISSEVLINSLDSILDKFELTTFINKYNK